jgi:hypothetical protein
MTIPLELPQAQEEKLRDEARRLGVPPEDLAKAAVVDLLNREADDFESAAQRVIRKNAELYRRLG